MASEDKTYCGQGDRNHVDEGKPHNIEELAEKFGVTPEDVLDAMEQAGHDLAKVEAYFRSKENSY